MKSELQVNEQGADASDADDSTSARREDELLGMVSKEELRADTGQTHPT